MKNLFSRIAFAMAFLIFTAAGTADPVTTDLLALQSAMIATLKTLNVSSNTEQMTTSRTTADQAAALRTSISMSESLVQALGSFKATTPDVRAAVAKLSSAMTGMLSVTKTVERAVGRGDTEAAQAAAMSGMPSVSALSDATREMDDLFAAKGIEWKTGSLPR